MAAVVDMGEAIAVNWSESLNLTISYLTMITGNGYGRQGGWNRGDNSGWNGSWSGDNYGDNSQWSTNSPWDNGQGQNWGNGNFNQNWSSDTFGSGYQQGYSGGSQRGYSGNNRMLPYGGNQSELTEFESWSGSGNFLFSLSPLSSRSWKQTLLSHRYTNHVQVSSQSFN